MVVIALVTVALTMFAAGLSVGFHLATWLQQPKNPKPIPIPEPLKKAEQFKSTAPEPVTKTVQRLDSIVKKSFGQEYEIMWE